MFLALVFDIDISLTKSTNESWLRRLELQGSMYLYSIYLGPKATT